MLYVNEAPTPQLQGHERVRTTLTAAMAAAGDLDLRVVGLEPLSGWRALAARPVPYVGRYDLDLQIVRWHLVQGRLLRAAVASAEAEGSVDVLVVNSHAIGLGAGDVVARLPTVLVVDATVEQWSSFGVFRRWMPWSRMALTPSLVLERRRFSQARAVLAGSAWARDGVRRTCPGATVEVVHPGLDLEVFHPAAKLPRDRPRLLFVGGRFEAKGGDDLLAAVGPALDAGELELDVVTTAELAPRRGMRVHRLGAGDPVLLDLYRQADLFVLPSHAEGNPWVVLEAMASGAPVVASSVGAMPEQVAGAGRLVSPGDRVALRRVVLELLADPEALAAMGAAARREVEARYDQRIQAGLVADVVRQAAG